jgi:hypothetical protein
VSIPYTTSYNADGSRHDEYTIQTCRCIPGIIVLYGRYGFVRSPLNRAEGSYGFQSNTKLRMVLSVALVDAMIKDSDIVAVSPPT